MVTPSLLVLLLLGTGGTVAFSQDMPPNALDGNRMFAATLQNLIDTALRNNPGLTAADAKIEAASAGVAYTRSLDPPLAGVDFMESPIKFFPNLLKDQMEIDYFVQQMIPYPGKLSSMARVEQKRADMFRADRKTQEQDIVRQIKMGYYELYLLHRAMEINNESQDLVRDFIEIARKQYEQGMGNLADILRAQTELSSIVNDRVVLDQQQKSTEGMLNALASRPVTTGIGFIPEVVPPEEIPDLSELLAIAETRRPELQSMQSNLEMQRAERTVAGKEILPDIMIRGSYNQIRGERDNWGLMLGLTVPLAPWSKQKYTAGKERADANIRQAQAEIENMKNMVAQGVNDAFQKVGSSRARIILTRDTTIPQARETLESAIAAYQTGKGDFLMLIDIQRMLVMAELDYHMAVMNLLDSRSQLERATGTTIEDMNGEPGR